LIFVGTGLYAGTPNEDLLKYLSSLHLKSTKQFALFITWGGAPRSDKMALTRLRALLEGKSTEGASGAFCFLWRMERHIDEAGTPKT
jgi:hypothetical protein